MSQWARTIFETKCHLLSFNKRFDFNVPLLIKYFVFEGLFDPDPPAPKLPHSPLYNPLLEGKLPSGFIVDLIKTTSDATWEEFKMVFTPLLQSLVTEGTLFLLA